MNKKITLLTLCVFLFALSFSAEAQPKRVPTIGILTLTSDRDPSLDAFRQGLHDLGYAEGKNIAILYRFGEGTVDGCPISLVS